jgi:hypothetical protein
MYFRNSFGFAMKPFFFQWERLATRTMDLGCSISMQIMVVPNVGFDPKPYLVGYI